MRFNTIVRADEQMLVTFHLWEPPGDQAPLIHLRVADQPGLFAHFEEHCESIWNHASHPIDPEPDLFPPPEENPDYYEGFLFDDAPPDQNP